ncbi:MAG: IMP dehydrogenase, partial [Brachybacterium sp.]|uniref:IMP dehydrogenase n=1 Tax=Brachybacterium sp. TaxID=1891286 RepID=UPI00324285F4
MSEIEIGRNKRGRRSYSFDDVAVVPSRRTRDPEDVSTAWQVDAYHFDIPIFAAPMDSLMSPETAIALGEHGGLGVLDLEGLWTRYEDPSAQFDRIAAASEEGVVEVMRRVYEESIKPELIRDRIQQLRDAGVTAAGSLSPQRTQEHWKTVVDAGVDL